MTTIQASTPLDRARDQFYEAYSPRTQAVQLVCSSALSIARQGLDQAADWSALLGRAGSVVGSAVVVGALRDIRDGCVDSELAQKMSDTTAVHKANSKLASGITSLFSGATYIAARVLPVYVSPILDMLSSLCFGIASLVTLGLAVRGITQCRSFESELSELQTDSQGGAKKALQFLLDAALVKGNPGEDHVRHKLKQLKTQTSAAGIDMILQRAPALLKALERNPTPQNKQAAHQLLSDIASETRKKRMVYTIGAFAALLGMVSAALGFVSGAWMIALAFGIAAFAINVGLAAVNYIGAKKPVRPALSEPEPSPTLVLRS